VLTYGVRRFVLFIPLTVGIVLVTFGLTLLLPGDPALVLLGQDAGAEAVAELRGLLHLDDPWYVRLGAYFAGLVQGDLGTSIFQGQPVAEVIGARLGATLELAAAALFVAVTLGVLLGVVAALRRGGVVDKAVMLFAQLGVSMPVFWLGILLMLLFAVQLGWLPAIGRGPPLLPALGGLLVGRSGPFLDSLAHLAMPALTLGLSGAAVISRLVRAAMLETLDQDYIRTAYAKGLSTRRVVWVHALRNALLPIVSVVGLRFGALLGGAVLTEGIFGWPGLGQLAVAAVSQRDLPLIQGIVLSFALLFALVNLLVDLLYGVIDPRIRLE
jgi:peptide/nickel transport system permease protein